MMMSKIVRTMTHLLVPLTFIYSVYLIMHGHLTPGGGFQGGGVFASAVALLIVAFGSQNIHKSLKEHHLSILESSGALIFIGLAFGGLAAVFFYNFLAVERSFIFGNIPPLPLPSANSGTYGLEE